MSKPAPHCWKDQAEHIEEAEGQDALIQFKYVEDRSGTCMLLAGHVGPHQFTPDSEIGVRFS